MTVQQLPFLIAPARLWPGEARWTAPVAVIDLNAADVVPGAIALPPCPVIGVGDADHPLARDLDALVEPPVAIEGLVSAICANPQAAAVTVQLLRLLPKMPTHDGLAAESLAYAVLQGSAEHARWLEKLAAAKKPVATREGRVGVSLDRSCLTITLDRPEAGNAIDRAMRDSLFDAFSLAALDPTLSRISLRARGRVFCLGAELSEFGTTRDPATAHAIRQLTLPARAVAAVAGRMDVHIGGACVGAGLELAAWAGRITASRAAWFQLPELAMGILPGAGGCVSLTRRIGRQRAALLILSGKRLNARQALGWGLIDALVDEAS